MTGKDANPKPPGASHATMTELMMPNMANSLGNVFGGVLLSLVDRVAAVSAIRHAQGPCVTVSVDRVDFREPIHVGELVTARASVNYVGRTSIYVGVRVEAEDIVKGIVRHTNSCYLTFVAIDAAGRPVAVPRLAPDTDEEVRRFKAAERRRALRLQEMNARGPT